MLFPVVCSDFIYAFLVSGIPKYPAAGFPHVRSSALVWMSSCLFGQRYIWSELHTLEQCVCFLLLVHGNTASFLHHHDGKS